MSLPAEPRGQTCQMAETKTPPLGLVWNCLTSPSLLGCHPFPSPSPSLALLNVFQLSPFLSSPSLSPVLVFPFLFPEGKKK